MAGGEGDSSTTLPLTASQNEKLFKSQWWMKYTIHVVGRMYGSIVLLSFLEQDSHFRWRDFSVQQKIHYTSF